MLAGAPPSISRLSVSASSSVSSCASRSRRSNGKILSSASSVSARRRTASSSVFKAIGEISAFHYRSFGGEISPPYRLCDSTSITIDNDPERGAGNRRYESGRKG